MQQANNKNFLAIIGPIMQPKPYFMKTRKGSYIAQ